MLNGLLSFDNFSIVFVPFIDYYQNLSITCTYFTRSGIIEKNLLISDSNHIKEPSADC